MATSWSDPTNINTDWRADFTQGRHTYGVEYGETTRIRFGDHVRYGGIANITPSVTNWSDPA